MSIKKESLRDGEMYVYKNIQYVTVKKIKRDALLLLDGLDKISLSPHIAPPFLPTTLPLNYSPNLSYSLLYSPTLSYTTSSVCRRSVAALWPANHPAVQADWKL